MEMENIFNSKAIEEPFWNHRNDL